MLNEQRVLSYVKDNLGFDFMVLELTDDNIMEYIKTYTLRDFSQYFPHVNRIGICLLDPNLKVPRRGNEYYINDPEGREILNVKDLYFNSGQYLMFGHPPIGPFTQGELKSWALDVEVAGMIKQFSSFDKTFEFRHPNIVRISPVPSDVSNCTVEYERVQADDFREVPNQFQIIFCQLALSDIMILLGRIRKKYEGQLSTPFGNIPISAEIGEEGKELRREVIEKLINGSLPNIIVNFG